MTTPRQFREQNGYPTYKNNPDFKEPTPMVRTYKLSADDVDALLKDYANLRIDETLEKLADDPGVAAFATWLKIKKRKRAIIIVTPEDKKSAIKTLNQILHFFKSKNAH